MNKFRPVNAIETRGLISIISDSLGCTDESYKGIDNAICGTSTNNLLNLQNIEVDSKPDEDYPYLGGFGLSEGDDIVLKYEDEDGNALYYWATFSELAHNFDPIERLKLYGGQMTKEMIELKSVGTAYNTVSGMTYPMCKDGTFDDYDGVCVHLNDTTDEWRASLSEEDRKQLYKYF